MLLLRRGGERVEMRRRRAEGLTLLEVLIASALLTFFFATVYGIVAGALAQRNRTEEVASPYAVGPIVIDEFQRRSLPQTPTRIVPTDRATQPRLRGAVTLVVQQHFGAPTVA